MFHICQKTHRKLSPDVQALSLAPAVLMGSGPYPKCDQPSMTLVTFTSAQTTILSPSLQFYKRLTTLFVCCENKIRVLLSAVIASHKMVICAQGGSNSGFVVNIVLIFQAECL